MDIYTLELAWNITIDFLCFCLLANCNNTILKNCNWCAYLKSAGKWAGFTFLKSDATERWGPISAMCLWIAAEKVYRCSARDGDSKCHDVEEISMLLKLVKKVLGMVSNHPFVLLKACKSVDERLIGFNTCSLIKEFE